ncbi:hypothetical protein ACFXTO_032146 [Malus domestica]
MPVEKKSKTSSATRDGLPVAKRIPQCRGSIMPLMLKSISRCPLGAKSGSPLERFVTMKSDKVDFAAKMAPKPIPLVAGTDSRAEKN